MKMNKLSKRIWALVLSLTMVLGMLPVGAMAAVAVSDTAAATIENGKSYVIGDGTNYVAYDAVSNSFSVVDAAAATVWTADASGANTLSNNGNYFYLNTANGGFGALTVGTSLATAAGSPWGVESGNLFCANYQNAQVVYYLTITADGCNSSTGSGNAKLYEVTASGNTEDDGSAFNSTTPSANTTDSTEFMRIFNLDCGRIFFTVDQIKGIIDELAKNDYTHLGLAFGNSGFRFLLDDMTIGGYSSEAVKNAILEGNTYYAANDGHNGSTATNTCLTETEMDSIIAYATDAGISIVPVLNSPGHMNTIVYAMGQLDISNAGYPVTSSYNSESTINIDNPTVTAFTNALIQKYITYFADKGCTMFNLGADEFANDPTDDTPLGFNDTMKAGFISYVNSVAAMISTASMTPLMFNDGYAWSDANFNNDIVICCWTSGNVNSTAIANAGHKIINTNQNWYYVLGEPFGTASNSWCSYAKALSGAQNVAVTTMVDGGSVGEKLIGAQMCLWCDYTDEVYNEEEETKVHTLIATLAKNNPDYFTIEETRNVTMQVYQTSAEFIHAVDDTVIKEPEASIAQMHVESSDRLTASVGDAVKSITDGDYVIYTYLGAYLTNELSGTALALNQTEQTVWHVAANSDDTYYITDRNGQYLYVADGSAGITSTPTAVSLDYGNGNDGPAQDGFLIEVGNYRLNNSGGTTSAVGKGGTGSWARWQFKPYTEASESSNKVTFTGVAVGNTTATIGNVNYNITVTEEDLTNVSLTYHPWLSNYSVHAEGTGASNCNGNLGVANPQTIAATSTGVNSESGAVFADLVWATGDWRWEEGAQTVFWKGTVLDEEHMQEGNGADDMCMDGADFTYIRYWGGSWSYSSDRVTWTAILDTDEVCAYYLQKTEVTQEVETYVKDWAFTADTAYGKDGNRYQKALSFAVVYPGGTMNPSEENIYANSTLIYWDNLEDLGFIRVGLSGDYEIDKITYTFGERAVTDNVNWTSNETINWEKTTINDEEWYDETVCWDEKSGTEPVVNGKDLSNVIYAGNATSGTTGYDGTWGANDAVLILIYLKPVVTEDSLTVIYYDEKFGDTLHDYSIIVNSEVNFNNGIGEVTTDDAGNVTINTNVKPGIFKAGTSEENANRIDVTGFGITNKVPVAESFQTDLTQVPDARGKYNNELYTYTGSVISEDGKTLYLYYNINTSVLKPNFVVDFGLPITFPLTDLLGAGTEVDDVTAVSGLSARYGVFTYDEINESFNYRPTSVINTIDVLSISLTIGGKTATTNVGVTPASNVLYEEGFMTAETGDSNYVDWTGGSMVGDATTQSNANEAPYGYDSQYSESTGVSNAVYSVTEMKSGDSTEYLTVDFYGDCFDLIGTCGPTTGYIFLSLIPKDSTGSFKMAMIDTSNSDGTYYQVPLAHVELTESNYTAQVFGAYRNAYTATAQTYGFGGGIDMDVLAILDRAYEDGLYADDMEFIYFDEDSALASYANATMMTLAETDEAQPQTKTIEKAAGTDVEIDGFRVYRNTDNDAYKDASGGLEYNATYTNCIDAVNAEKITAYVESSSGEYAVENYEASGGPQNEIYLLPGQSVAFGVTEGAAVQVSLRSVTGSEMTANGTTIKHATEMYYSVTNVDGIVTITNDISNDSGEILGIGNIKAALAENTASVASVMMLSEDDQPAVFSLLRRGGSKITAPESESEDTPVVPDTPTKPEKPSTPVRPGVPSIIWPTYTPSQNNVFRPENFDMDVESYTLFGKRYVSIIVDASTDVSKLTINGAPVWASNYLWVKSGRDDQYRFTMLLVLNQGEKANFQVVAYDKNGTASKTYTITD